MKPLRTWALIAGGAHARILENNGPIHGDSHHGSLGHGESRNDWMPVEGLSFNGNHAATHDLVSDRQGRSFSSTGSGRSAIEPHTDPHRALKTKFAHHLAEILAKELEAGAFHRLIIAAPPAMLGDLRHSISDKVRATVIAEFPHDLTKTPNHEIAGHLTPLPL
ncbi:MAG: host attachment protein [Alphaproteobacteria bacterium]